MQDLIQDFVLYDNSNNLLKINNITIDSNDQKLILTMNRSVPNVLIEYSKSNTILTNVEASQESIPEKAIIQDFSLKVSNNDYYATIGEQGFNKILFLELATPIILIPSIVLIFPASEKAEFPPCSAAKS